jgi:hypothetical protein
MLMLTNWISLIFGCGLFVLAAQCAATMPGWAVAFTILAIFLVLPFFIYGSVPDALAALRKQDIAAARDRIAETPFPTLLVGSMWGCYHWVHGILAWDQNNWTEARERLMTALRCVWIRGEARALLMGHLAVALAGCGDLPGAQAQIAVARILPHSPPMAEYLATVAAALQPEAWLARTGDRWTLSPRGAFTALSPHSTYR